MLVKFQNYQENEGCFYINSNIQAKANAVLNTPILNEFFTNFNFGKYSVSISEVDELSFIVGNASKPSLNGCDYAVNVCKNGIYAIAVDKNALVRAYLTLLMQVKITSDGVNYINSATYQANVTNNLMAHYCLFYDTKLYDFEKFVRLIGACGYTHLILEFWGSYKYECLSELGWKNAYTYSQIKPIINIANDLGVEVIPMFNHWGHASQSRVMHGKHVVLNQNPSLQYLFNESGWCYNYASNKVKELLKKVRKELINLCGNGSYFHIGCDEAYGFNYTSEEIENITNFINEINSDLQSDNRKTIMWGDMLLSKQTYQDDNVYCVGAPTTSLANAIIEKLNKSIIIADWQYHAKNYPVQTCLTLKDAGFNVIVCPWDRGTLETDACIKTANEHNLSGVMHTTWHTLTSGMPHVVRTASVVIMGGEAQQWLSYNLKTAELLRKVYATSDYEKAGWSPYDIGVLT